jgi:trehalose 6-phosphate phosphatase
VPGHAHEQLPVPVTTAGVDALAALLAAPGQALLATDYDGTLSPIVALPQDAVPAPGAVDALEELAGWVAELAIITGRPVADVLAFTDARSRSRLNRLVILGQYGVQRWDARTGELQEPAPLPGVAIARAFLAEHLPTGPAGVWVEDKGHSLVVHVRQAEDPETAGAALEAQLRPLAEREGLHLAPGRMVLELRPPGQTKRDALLSLTDEYTRNHGEAPSGVVFCGDDLGDLPAFDAIDQLRTAGVPGLAVCSDSAEVTEVRERADIVVDGPAGLVRFFASLAAELARRQGS